MYMPQMCWSVRSLGVIFFTSSAGVVSAAGATVRSLITSSMLKTGSIVESVLR